MRIKITNRTSHLCLKLLVLGLVACGESATTGTNNSLDRTSVADVHESTSKTPVAEDKARGVLELGKEKYALSMVFCIGTSMATITANDSQRRADYPVVSVKIYDPAMTGGQSHDTVSAYFERDGFGENWALQEGSVERDGDIVTASGMLKGRRLVPKDDGTRESAPLEGNDLRTFELRIEC